MFPKSSNIPRTELSWARKVAKGSITKLRFPKKIRCPSGNDYCARSQRLLTEFKTRRKPYQEPYEHPVTRPVINFPSNPCILTLKCRLVTLGALCKNHKISSVGTVVFALYIFRFLFFVCAPLSEHLE